MKNHKKLEVNKNCEYCKAKIAHIIILGNEAGESHVHAPFNSKRWLEFLIGAFNFKIKILTNKKEK